MFRSYLNTQLQQTQSSCMSPHLSASVAISALDNLCVPKRLKRSRKEEKKSPSTKNISKSNITGLEQQKHDNMFLLVRPWHQSQSSSHITNQARSKQTNSTCRSFLLDVNSI